MTSVYRFLPLTAGFFASAFFATAFFAKGFFTAVFFAAGFFAGAFFACAGFLEPDRKHWATEYWLPQVHLLL